MSRPLTSVKKETRILGIDTCNKKFIIGVVTRGGIYLDGVIRFSKPLNIIPSDLATAITRTKYFPELRAIMIHDLSDRWKPNPIQRITRLPVITVSLKQRTDDSSFQLFKEKRRRLWIRTGFATTSSSQILSLTWRNSGLPEPLRIAHLLAKKANLGPN